VLAKALNFRGAACRWFSQASAITRALAWPVAPLRRTTPMARVLSPPTSATGSKVEGNESLARVKVFQRPGRRWALRAERQ